jgi:rhodanese-related sulfurtransferase
MKLEAKTAYQSLERYQVVDVREAEEFAESRIPGAKLLPLSEFAARVAELPKDEPVVLYCRSGGRSAQAAAWLAAKGHAEVLNLEGGILAWYRAGLPLDTTPVEATYRYGWMSAGFEVER